MSITILYFARIKEALEIDREELDFEKDISTIQQLVSFLGLRGEKWQTTLAEKSILVAVNHTVANFSTALNDDDEIAFYPPVTGG
ncbi:molybdopterin synthase sulfur carrier subunit [Aurantivibrio infirmus]